MSLTEQQQLLLLNNRALHTLLSDRDEQSRSDFIAVIYKFVTDEGGEGK